MKVSLQLCHPAEGPKFLHSSAEIRLSLGCHLLHPLLPIISLREIRLSEHPAPMAPLPNPQPPRHGTGSVGAACAIVRDGATETLCQKCPKCKAWNRAWPSRRRRRKVGRQEGSFQGARGEEGRGSRSQLAESRSLPVGTSGTGTGAAPAPGQHRRFAAVACTGTKHRNPRHCSAHTRTPLHTHVCAQIPARRRAFGGAVANGEREQATFQVLSC